MNQNALDNAFRMKPCVEAINAVSTSLALAALRLLKGLNRLP